MGSSARVSIPNSVRNTIQNIKEITGNHSEEEIYAMLKECSMDPNETTQKLLLQDPFHEVKRKRDKRKENLNSKESAESRWRPGMSGRGTKGGRGNYSPRYVSHDTGGGRTAAPGKENGLNQVSDKGAALPPLPTTQETKNQETTPAVSSESDITDEPTCVASGSTTVVHDIHLSVGSVVNQSEVELGGPPPLPPHVDAQEKPTTDCGPRDSHGRLTLSSSDSSASLTPAPSGVYFSASDPVLVPSHDSWLPGAVGTIKREVGIQRTPVEQISAVSAESKSTAAASEVRSSFMQEKMPNNSQGVGKNQLSESAQPASSGHGGSSVIRPSSNYHGRSQQLAGPQKVGPSKEWKPKPANPNLTQGSRTASSSEIPTTVEANNTQARSLLSDLASKEDTSSLQKKLEESHISDVQHVIIPNHLHVPEAEKLGFCFGSFDASFGLSTSYNNDPESDKSPTPLSETSEGIEETVELPSSNQNAFATAEEGEYPDHPQSPTHEPENLPSSEEDVSSSAVPGYIESKQETALQPGNNQYSMVHTSPNYSFGFMPSMLSGQLAPFESSESQARDVSRLPNFVVPQPFDPAGYYAQFYRSAPDSDGRISPFHSPGVATKYNANVAVLSPLTSQSPQEGGNSMVLSTAGPTPVTQATGVMQSSIAVTQQPLPIFRQHTGVHMPHYPPNYIPYGHYFSPYYVPPPAIHQFLSNGAFPQQPQGGNIYPAPPAATAKYSLPQYKPGTNTGNSTHIGVPGGYASYGSSPAGYNPGSATTAGNSTANEDMATSQYKENNVYITGQQTEGSAVWIAPPGRDMSGLPASSFYNIPQGQVTFAPTQAGHGGFTGMYHPAQAVSPTTVHPLLQQSQTMAGPIDMVGPTTSVYQQPQHAPINWPNNY